MKTGFARLAFLSVMFLSGIVRADFYDFNTYDKGAAYEGGGWNRTATGESARGYALLANGEASATFTVGSQAHAVATFLAKTTDGSQRWIVISVNGRQQEVPVSGTAWARCVLDLEADGSEMTVVISTEGSVWLDDLYIGRQLCTTTQDSEDVLGCTSAAQGLVSRETGVGMWVPALQRTNWTVSASSGLTLNLGTVNQGQQGLLKMVPPVQECPSDSLTLTFWLLAQSKEDFVKPVFSTNNWVSYSDISDYISTMSTAYEKVSGNWMKVEVQKVKLSSAVVSGWS